MRKIFLTVSMLIAASFILTSCGAPAANNATNAGNKPTIVANNGTVPAANTATVEAEVKKLVTDTAAMLAKNDADGLEKIYGDTYMLVNLDGSVQNKAERLASFRSGDTKFESFAYDEVTVRTNPEGTGAVVIARAITKGINKGKPVAADPIRVTQVWSKMKDGWRQVSGHASTITAAAAPTKAGDKVPATNAAKPATPANK